MYNKNKIKLISILIVLLSQFNIYLILKKQSETQSIYTCIGIFISIVQIISAIIIWNNKKIGFILYFISVFLFFIFYTIGNQGLFQSLIPAIISITLAREFRNSN